MRKRITFQKREDLKFTGSLDLLTIWQRSIKRAELKLDYSQGFHPQPKIQLPFPLPLGFSGINEIVDIWFSEDYLNSHIVNKLTPALPRGIIINSIEDIEGHPKSISSFASYADYSVRVTNLLGNCDTVRNAVNTLLEKSSLIRVRNIKEYDLRPLILSIDILEQEEESCTLIMRLMARSSKTGRPDEVAMEMGLELSDCEIERLNVHFDLQ